MFVDLKAPGSAYGMTYNCIACGDNAITFNDGYHIQHHLNSRTHWSELPLRFMEGLEEHAVQAGDCSGALLVSEAVQKHSAPKMTLWKLPYSAHCHGISAWPL